LRVGWGVVAGSFFNCRAALAKPILLCPANPIFAPLLQELDQGDKASSALKPGYYPGDLGFDPLNLKPEDPAELALMQEKELSHCRLAMIAAAGFLAQEAVSKQTWGAWWGDASF